MGLPKTPCAAARQPFGRGGGYGWHSDCACECKYSGVGNRQPTDLLSVPRVVDGVVDYVPGTSFASGKGKRLTLLMRMQS